MEANQRSQLLVSTTTSSHLPTTCTAALPVPRPSTNLSVQVPSQPVPFSLFKVSLSRATSEDGDERMRESEHLVETLRVPSPTDAAALESVRCHLDDLSLFFSRFSPSKQPSPP
jgi:hypothetical protein